MKIIWVLENIKKLDEYQGKFHTLLMLASVSQWKKYRPQDYTNLYCCQFTFDFLNKLDVLKLWDTVNIIDFVDDTIDKKVFWASSKLKILQQQTEPVIILDNDVIVYDDVVSHFEPDVTYVANLENGKGYYPLAYDEFVRRLSTKKRWKSDSVNVSLLHIPDVAFAQDYATKSIEMMREFTAMKVPNSQYLIFSEQLLLATLLREAKKQVKSIIASYWDCNLWWWKDYHDHGLWEYPESNKHFFHYGPLKRMYLNPKDKIKDYDKEVQKFVNCINLPNLDLELFQHR